MDMSGDFGDDRRPVVSDRAVLQKKPHRFRWWMVCSALLTILIICVVAAVWMRRTAPAESAAPVTANVADNQTRLRERGAAMLVAAQKAKLEAAASLPAAQRPEPEMTAKRQARVPDPGPNTVAASTAQREAGLDTIASPPEAQTSTPAPAVSPPEVQQSKSEQETAQRQPENQAQAQAPASNAVTQPTEDQAPRTDTVAILPDTQRSKPETASPDMQTSKPEIDIATRQQPNAQKPGSKAPAPPSDTQSPGSKDKDKDKDKDTNADKVVAVPQLVLPDDVAQKVGHKIWLNETDGNRDGITSWNAGEEFASLGIGPFSLVSSGQAGAVRGEFSTLARVPAPTKCASALLGRQGADSALSLDKPC
jgi:hypothetical protein